MRPPAPVFNFDYPAGAQLRHGLADIYSQLERELEAKQTAGAQCNACGGCCDFKNWGHELWLTSMELSLLVTEHPLDPKTIDGVCPYLKEGKCTARIGRTLGCRVFHCGLPAQIAEQLHEKYLQKILDLGKDLNLDCEYGELLASLNQAKVVTSP